MLGLEIRIVSKTKEGLLLLLDEIKQEIDKGHTNMFLPLNDKDNSQADYSISEIGYADHLYSNWDDCLSIERI